MGGEISWCSYSKKGAVWSKYSKFSLENNSHLTNTTKN